MKKHLYITFILNLSSIILLGQNSNLTRTSIPFNLVDGKYIFIKAVVNKKDTLTFFFDTGSSITAIDKNSAKVLGILPNSTKGINSASEDIICQSALNQKIGLGEMQLDDIELVFEDLSNLKKAMGHSFGGIIGNDLMKNYVTKIDFDKQVIKLYTEKTKLNLTSFSEHNFTFENGVLIPQLEIKIELINGEKYKGNVLLDTGAGLNLLVNTSFKNNLLKQSQKTITRTSTNFSSKTNYQEMVIAHLNFCGYSFPELPILLSSDESGVSSDERYLGILGVKILNRFNIILDYQKKKIYLKPNSLFKQPIEFDLSGISLQKNKEKGVFIANVVKESLAYKKGIRIGDKVISISGNSKGNIKEYRDLLKKEGKKIKIIINNKQEKKVYKIRLKRIL